MSTARAPSVRRDRRRPRVLCVYQHAPTPGAPGIYRHRLYFAELVRRGFAVDLVSTPLNYMTGEVPPAYRGRPYRHEVIDGIDHHWVWASKGIHASKVRRIANYGSFAAAATARALVLRRPDVIVVSSPPLTVGMAGPLLARRHRAPWLLEVRDIWPESAASVGWLSAESRSYRALERIAHRLASTASSVIVPTPGLVEPVRAHGATHVDVVPGTVVDARPGEEERRTARLRLGLADETCAIVYTGAVGVANGLDVLVDAVAHVRADADLAVLVAGDGSARADLERRVAAESVDRLRILGPVAKDGVRELLAAADVCLHLLRPDPVFESAQPTKMLEYFGAHRAVITTVPGRPRELAESSGGAFAAGPVELAQELERWAAMSPGERARRGDEAHGFGEREFGLTPSVDRLEAILRRAIDGSA